MDSVPEKVEGRRIRKRGADEDKNEVGAAPDEMPGKLLDRRFLVKEQLGAGGFGAVYRAIHVKSGREVAIKVLLPNLGRDPGVVGRFRREAHVLTSLRNPHTLCAYELAKSGDQMFIVMELLRGESMYDRLVKYRRLEWSRVVKMIADVCESLAEAHMLGIVHRDLKPNNIHLEHHADDPDFVKVLDFGIAKIVRGKPDATQLTVTGHLLGTLEYMSPEQITGEEITEQSDIYAVGLIMYELISGIRAYPEASNASTALALRLSTKPEPLARRGLAPADVDRIIARCLHPERHRRYRTAEDLLKDLRRIGARGTADNLPLVDPAEEAATVPQNPQAPVGTPAGGAALDLSRASVADLQSAALGLPHPPVQLALAVTEEARTQIRRVPQRTSTVRHQLDQTTAVWRLVLLVLVSIAVGTAIAFSV